MRAEVRAVPYRPAPVKPEQTALAPGRRADRVIVKFARGFGVRWDGQKLDTSDETKRDALTAAARLIDRHNARSLPLIDLDADALRAAREQLEQARGSLVPDMTLYFDLLLDGDDAAALCDALNALDIVELAYPAAQDVEPPGDIAPATPSFVDLQGYRDPAVDGLGVDYAWNHPGARGGGVFVIDVEYDWYDQHEDLEAALGQKLVYEPRGTNADHGTAVLGVLAASDDEWGVSGFAPDAQLGMITQHPVGQTNSVARAITAATGLLSAGDVLVVSAQTLGPQGTQVPVEWDQAEFDAIAAATAAGIIVVEPAGNGDTDLDSPAFGGAFDIATRDSGAIIVGGGNTPDGIYPDRSRTLDTSYGSRVDVQGWGEWVMTTGYGFHWSGDDENRQDYRRDFSGTSAAAPQVAGVVAVLQGMRNARGDALLTPSLARSTLASTGSAQQAGPVAGNVGPLPDLREAIRSFEGLWYDSYVASDSPNGNGDGVIDPGETIQLTHCLYNGHPATATNLSGTITNSPMAAVIKIIGSDAGYLDIPSAAVDCTTGTTYEFVVEPTATCGSMLHFAIDLVSDIRAEPTGIDLQVGSGGACNPFSCGSPAPPAVPPTVLVTASGDDIVLDWDSAGGSTTDYRVWRSRTSTFTDEQLVATPVNPLDTVATAPGELTDPEGLAFYLVRAHNECGWEGP